MILLFMQLIAMYTENVRNLTNDFSLMGLTGGISIS